MVIGFIGGGNMAEAMIKGMVNHGHKARDIIVFDRNKIKCNNLVKKYSILVGESVSDLIKRSNILVLAIKPQGMIKLVKDIKKFILDRHIIITVAAGIDVEIYEKNFDRTIAFARAIPNTPGSLGYGATGVYFNDRCSEQTKSLVVDIMKTIGMVVVVESEKEIDLIASVTSSGPAYYFQFMEHMANSVVKRGLEKSQAERLIAQTCLGAAQMALNSDDSLSELREKVTSEKGITFEALKVFEDSSFGMIVDDAIQANIDRSEQIAKENKDYQSK